MLEGWDDLAELFFIDFQELLSALLDFSLVLIICELFQALLVPLRDNLRDCSGADDASDGDD